MTKEKFELTTDLVKVEKEIVSDTRGFFEELSPTLSEKTPQKKPEAKEQLNLKISPKIKKEFKLWCIRNATNMTDALELAIKELIKK